MLYDCKRISYWIDRRLTGLAGPDYAATISFGLPFEPEDSQYGKSRLTGRYQADCAFGHIHHFDYGDTFTPCTYCRIGVIWTWIGP